MTWQALTAHAGKNQVAPIKIQVAEPLTKQLIDDFMLCSKMK